LSPQKQQSYQNQEIFSAKSDIVAFDVPLMQATTLSSSLIYSPLKADEQFKTVMPLFMCLPNTEKIRSLKSGSFFADSVRPALQLKIQS
jgi:hypothetical protein